MRSTISIDKICIEKTAKSNQNQVSNLGAYKHNEKKADFIWYHEMVKWMADIVIDGKL